MTKSVILPLVAAGLMVFSAGAQAEDARLAGARQALADGLPQVAVYQIRQNLASWKSPADKAAANLLLAQALFEAGRYKDSAALLQKMPGDEARFRLAQALAAQDQFAGALALYEELNAGPYADRAMVGRARMLKALGRAREAESLLAAAVPVNPTSFDLAVELAETRLDMNDAAGALAALAAVRNPPPAQAQNVEYLRARALLASGDPARAEEKLRALGDPPARLAAGVKLALAQCQLRQRDPADAEKILEDFIEKSPRLPGLEDVFATLDRVYAMQGASSSTELRRWSEDDKEPARAALALLYLARNEARMSKAERSRQFYAQFLQENPGHPLANEAREELGASLLAASDYAGAQAVLKAGQGARISFLLGKVLAAQGNDKEAAAAFWQAASLPEIEKSALFNSALCALLADIPPAQNQALQRLTQKDDKDALEKIAFYAALHAAMKRQGDAVEALREIANSPSPFAAQAALALAEWDNLQLDVKGAQRELQRIANADPATQERADTLAIFLADTGSPESEAEVIRRSEAFLKDHPNSPFAAEVRMKWGEILFRRGDYLGARSQFAAISEDFPDSPLVEKAKFLSAQAQARSMDPVSMEEAIEAYEKVAKGGGPLALRARLGQAVLWNALNRTKEATGVLDRILSSKPDPELRYMTLIEKGDTLFAQGPQDPKNYTAAIETWKQISADPAAPKAFSHQALQKMGSAWEKLGNNDAALDCYYSVFAQGQQKGEPEYFWFYKAGFDAGSLLEAQKLWKEAVAVYEKIGSVDGPRAEEARERVNKLRLENFIWDN